MSDVPNTFTIPAPVVDTVVNAPESEAVATGSCFYVEGRTDAAALVILLNPLALKRLLAAMVFAGKTLPNGFERRKCIELALQITEATK